MQFSTLTVLLVSAGLVAAQEEQSKLKAIGNLQPDPKCLTKPNFPVYLKKCYKVDQFNPLTNHPNRAVRIDVDGITCYGTKSAGCLDAGTPVKVGKGCHELSEFKDAKAIKCLKH
ncbi:uncharacterized protein PG998_009298 [Apiospora kogelbergensis]|uniref:uncharacterized protein n=1 Tax=Apiospora kogelbergensis TaxID=1337665 RepID=UPI003130BF56